MSLEIVQFEIPGPVKGKGRPRAFKRGNHIAMHTDKKTMQYEHKVQVCYKEEYGPQMMDGALQVLIEVFQRIPKSFSKVKREKAVNGKIRPTRKPDADNIIKVICDGLNKVAYDDDKQIVDVGLTKMYTDGQEYAYVIIRRIGEEP